MQYQPRDYQRAITRDILLNPKHNVWAGMGTGKTAATLDAISTMVAIGEVSKVLVVAPVRVATSVWPEEIRKWDHLGNLTCAVVCGTEKQRLLALHRKDANIFTINYENLQWLRAALNGRWFFDMVVADESTKLKGFRLKQGSIRAWSLAKMGGVRTRRFINLTGTPSGNGLLDLWGQQYFIDRGERLGATYTQFRDRWFAQNHDGHSYRPMPYTDAQIHDRMHDCCTSVEARDYMDLPDMVTNSIKVKLPPKARRLYTEMEKQMFIELAGEEVEAFNAASKTIKCLQLASGACYLPTQEGETQRWEPVHDAKLEALDDIIEEANGEPVLVAYHFKSDLARLKKRYKQGRELDKDPKTILDWNAGEIPLLFLHPASAGHGLNLQDGGRIMVFFSHWWSLEEYLQAIERIGPTRQLQSGHPRTVYLHLLIAEGTVDEVVVAARQGKQTTQQALIDYMKRKNHVHD